MEEFTGLLFMIFKAASITVAPLWSQTLQICSVLTLPKTKHLIFILLLSFTSSAFSVHQVHLLGVALGLAWFVFSFPDEGGRAYHQLGLTECQVWLLWIEVSCVLLHPLSAKYTEWSKTVWEKFLSPGLEQLFFHTSTPGCFFPIGLQVALRPLHLLLPLCLSLLGQ